MLEAPLCSCGATFPPRLVGREFCSYARSRGQGVFGSCSRAIDNIYNPPWQRDPPSGAGRSLGDRRKSASGSRARLVAFGRTGAATAAGTTNVHQDNISVSSGGGG